MRTPRKQDSDRIQLSPLEEEINEIKSIYEELRLPPKGKSEIFIGFILEGLRSMQSKKESYTNTKTQKSLKQQRLEFLDELEVEIIERGYISLNKIISIFCYQNPLFNDLGIVSKSGYIANILTNSNYFILDISKYVSGLDVKYLLIHRDSYLYPQIQDLLISLYKEPINKLRILDSRCNIKSYEKKLFKKLYEKSYFSKSVSNLDKAEKIVIQCIARAIDNSIDDLEKNIFKNNYTLESEVIRLRSEHNFKEANQILKNKETEEEVKPVAIDEGLSFISSLEVEK